MAPLARVALSALALLVLVVSLQNMARPLANPDEGRYSEISREMVETGDWVTPRLNGLKYLEKPPLQYWATALAFRAFGTHEWSARLYVFLCALGTVALVAFTASRLGGRGDGLAAALALAASPYFMGLSGAVTLDMGLTFWLTVALCAWLLAERPRLAPSLRRRWMLAAWAGMAMAVLSKGLVGIVIPAASLLVVCVLRRDFRPLARLEWAFGLTLFVALAAPWFIAVSYANPEFVEFFFVHEHVTRYLTAEHRRTEPPWYFLPIVLLGFLPWAFALPAAVWASLRDHAGLGAALAWAVFVVAFFSISGSKLPAYVLPAFPPLALVLGRYLVRAPERRLALWLAPAGLLAVGAIVAADRAPDRAREEWTRLLYLEAEPWMVGAGIALATGIAVAGVLLWHRRREAGLAVASLAVVGSLGCLLEAFEAFAPRQSGKAVAEKMLPHLKPETRLFEVDIHDQSLPFYLGRTLTLVKYRDEFDLGLKAEPSKGLETFEQFAAEWRRPGEAMAIMQPGHFTMFRAQGLPMQLLHEDPRRILVRKP